MATLRWLAVVLVALWLAGCSGRSPQNGAPPSEAGDPSGPASHREYLRVCVDRVAAYWPALKKYAHRHRGRLPTGIYSVPALLEKLGDDAPDDQSAHICPIHLDPYTWNDTLNGKVLQEIPNPSQVPLIYEAPITGGHSNGQCSALYADGKAILVPRERLREQLEALGASAGL